jgi:hypothetical protein
MPPGVTKPIFGEYRSPGTVSCCERFMMTAPPDHRRRVAAQQYARHGLAVFPVTPDRNDPPLVPWRSLETTRPSQETVVRWFQRFPTANVVVVTGAVSGVTVLDIDC